MTTNEVPEVLVTEIVQAVQKKLTKRAQHRAHQLEIEIRTERNWIRDHGGNLAGYVGRYGSASDPEHYGDGGEAIYAADRAALERKLAEYEALTGRKI